MSQIGTVMNRHIILSNKLLVALSGISTWTSRDGHYTYEKHNYHISESYMKQKWTKSAIRQFLAYASLANPEGHIYFASEEDLAELINCSVRTIQENNKSFEANGIIEFRRIWGEFLDIRICDYTREVRDLDISESGEVSSRTGYTSVWHEVMGELFKIENINELRLALRCLLFHEKEVHVQRLDEAILSYDEIKGFLPKYIGYKKAIKQLTENLSNIFHISCLESKEMVKELFHRQTKKRPSLMDKLSKPFALSFEIMKSEDSRIIREKERAETMIHWFEFKKSARSYLAVEQAGIAQRDLNTLSDTYGSSIVKEGLERISRMFESNEYGQRLHYLYDEFKSEPYLFVQKRIHSLYLSKSALV